MRCRHLQLHMLHFMLRPLPTYSSYDQKKESPCVIRWLKPSRYCGYFRRQYRSHPSRCAASLHTPSGLQRHGMRRNPFRHCCSQWQGLCCSSVQVRGTGFEAVGRTATFPACCRGTDLQRLPETSERIHGGYVGCRTFIQDSPYKG